MHRNDDLSEILDKPNDLIILPDSELKRLNTMIGILFVVTGLVLSAFHLAFFIICLLSLLPFTRRQGVEISSTGMQFRRYSGYFGHRSGQWKNIPKSGAVVILTKDGSKMVQGIRFGPGYRYSGTFYELYVMDTNHHHRVLLQVFSEAKQVSSLAKRVSTALELPIEEFNPVPLR